jgi:hypothetical protein
MAAIDESALLQLLDAHLKITKDAKSGNYTVNQESGAVFLGRLLASLLTQYGLGEEHRLVTGGPKKYYYSRLTGLLLFEPLNITGRQKAPIEGITSILDYLYYGNSFLRDNDTKNLSDHLKAFLKAREAMAQFFVMFKHRVTRVAGEVRNLGIVLATQGPNKGWYYGSDNQPILNDTVAQIKSAAVLKSSDNLKGHAFFKTLQELYDSTRASFYKASGALAYVAPSEFPQAQLTAVAPFVVLPEEPNF